MSSDLGEFVMQHPLFSHHDHHASFKMFEDRRPEHDALSLLGYATADLATAGGPRVEGDVPLRQRATEHWSKIAATGYGRAVTLGCRALFDLDFCPENFDAITERLQAALADRSPSEVYDYFNKEQANVHWVLEDSCFDQGNPDFLDEKTYPQYYRFAWRLDKLFAIRNAKPIEELQELTGVSIDTLDEFVVAMHASIDAFKATGRLAAFKLGIAYLRDLRVGDPTIQQAQHGFDHVRAQPVEDEGLGGGVVDPVEARMLSDYMLHRLLDRADDENIPVQIHTGYLAGNWGALESTRAMFLAPVLRKFRGVRFDIFHASWPWTSELGVIAKNYPNVYPDMCWAWTMNPTGSERTLSEWLDSVPFNKIFAFGADTGLPWCEMGYATQARRGIARVLEEKVAKGCFSEATAREIATAIMIENGKTFHGMD